MRQSHLAGLLGRESAEGGRPLDQGSSQAVSFNSTNKQVAPTQQTGDKKATKREPFRWLTAEAKTEILHSDKCRLKRKQALQIF